MDIALVSTSWHVFSALLILFFCLLMCLKLDSKLSVKETMAVSLETRVPFLDHRVVEFAWRMPLDMKIRNGESKWALRQVLYRHVPKELIERPKMGFAIPLHDWLRGPLKEWANALLDEKRIAQEGYFNPEPVTKLWKDHVSGKFNYGDKLWPILMFQSWLEAQ